MSTVALEVAREKHEAQVEANRALGIIEYESKGRQSDAVYEVTEGRHRLPDGTALTPGKRFHPLERQVTGGKRGRSTLAGKAREVTATERRGIASSRTTVAGADIGLRTIPMTNHAMSLATDAKLDVSDFDGIEPAHEQGFTKGQVEDIIARRAQS
jgi:hypothetical protein